MDALCSERRNSRMGHVVAAALVAFAVVAAPDAQAQEGTVNAFEAQFVGDDAVVITRGNIVLVWSDELEVRWYGESGIQSAEQLADWLEMSYRMMALWTRHDPNRFYHARTGQWNRLVFCFRRNGEHDFIFGGSLARPFIGLRRDGIGSEDYFGWLAHELSHDFWHEHPDFKSEKGTWGEGMCDYSRYYLLLNNGMPEAARRWAQQLASAPPGDTYRGAAYAILLLDRSRDLDGPAGLWQFMRGKRFTDVLPSGSRGRLRGSRQPARDPVLTEEQEE